MAQLETQDTQTSDSKGTSSKRKKSAGEALFDRVVYTGIGFGVNEASSLWITDQFIYGKNLLTRVPGFKKAGAWFSQEGFNRASEFIAKIFRLTEKTAKDGNKILPKERGGNALLMVTLLSGGTLLILPMKWLENRKIYWIEKANHLMDRLRSTKLTQEERVARDAEVKQDIACSPKQSWPGLIIGRTIAATSSVAAGTFLMGPKNNDKLMNWSEKLFTGNLQPDGRKSAAHRYARLISVETYSCAISSLTLEIMSKLFARHKYIPHDSIICNDAGAMAADGGDTKMADGCAGNHCAKIQLQKDQLAEKPHLMQV